MKFIGWIGLAAIILILLWRFFDYEDCWDNPEATYGYKKGSILQLASDAYLYKSKGIYSLRAIKTTDSKNDSFLVTVPKGTEIRFTRIKRINNWISINYVQYGNIVTPGFYDDEIMLKPFLMGF